MLHYAVFIELNMQNYDGQHHTSHNIPYLSAFVAALYIGFLELWRNGRFLFFEPRNMTLWWFKWKWWSCDWKKHQIRSFEKRPSVSVFHTIIAKKTSALYSRSFLSNNPTIHKLCSFLLCKDNSHNFISYNLFKFWSFSHRLQNEKRNKQTMKKS